MKKLSAIIILTLAALFSFQQFWLPKGVILTFDYKLHHPITFKIFYGLDSDGKWRANETVCYKAENTQGHAEIFLPVSHLERLRIDPGTKPKHVVISQLVLDGKDTLVLGHEENDFRAHNIPEWKVKRGEIRLASEHDDPILMYNKPISMIAGNQRQINWSNLLLLLLTPWYLVYVICSLWKERNTNNCTARIPSLVNIEFLRILFTIGVLICHFRHLPYKLYSGGGQGVEFFFLLSGYLLALTYKPERTLLDIAKRNWIRFVPLVVVGGLLHTYGSVFYANPFKSLYGIFMLQGTGLAYMNVPNLPAWYIAVLFWCSLFYLGLIKYLGSERQCFVIGVISIIACAMVAQTPGDRCEMVAGYVPRGMMRGLACMGLGVVLAKFCIRSNSDEPQKSISTKLWYTFAEFGILAYIISSFFTKEYYIIEHWIFTPITHIALLVLFVKKRGYISSFFEHPMYAKLAKYCLAIYLIHGAFPFEKFWRVESIPLSITIGIVFSCVVGIIAYYAIEKPFIKLLTPLLTRK